jgi:hypothetical protein
MLSCREAEKMKNRERGTHRSLADGGGTAAASVQKKIQSPSNVAAERGGGVVDKVSGVVERRRRPGADRRRSRLSVPWSGEEAQEAEEQRKKKALWG